MNSILLSPIRRVVCPILFAAAAIAFLATLAGAAAPREAPAPLKELGYSGSQSALEAVDAGLAAARGDPARLAALQQQLLDVVRDTDTTFAARQAACQRLGLVLQVAPAQNLGQALKALRPLLADERDIDLARLALEPIPGEVVDAIFLEALGNASGRSRLGLVQALGARQGSTAVEKLGELAGNADDEIATAAIAALGEIGGSAALAALERAAGRHPAALTQARLAAARRIPASGATPILAGIQADAAVPAHLRAAAFRTLLGADPEAAGPRIIEALRGGDWAMKEAAFDAAASLPADQIVPGLVAQFADFEPATQVAVLSLFARKGHAAAVPAALKATADENPDVRNAAIRALGFLPGTPEIAGLLARLVGGASDADAKAARKSLAQLKGPGVAEAVLAGAERGEPALRLAYIEQLPLRSATGAVPMLLAARHDSDPKVRTAAAAALGDLGSMAEQGALIEWVQGATDEGEQSRAIRSLVEVTLRNPAVETRGAAVFAALEKSQPELALRWLPVLQRIGGTASAGCAARLAVRESPELATAATATLARWSDHTALASLATVTEKAASPEVRRAALDGALRYFERNREPWTPATTRLISRLLASATDIEARSSLVALLNRANDRGAIAVARKAAADPALAAKAGAAIEVIRANLAGPPVVRASGNQENVANIIDGKPNTRWNVAAREGEWLEIEFKRSRPLSRLTLEQGGRDGEFPERYEVFVSDDRRNPGPVRATGGGQQQRTVISLPEGTRGRIVMIRNTAGRSSPQWSVFELHVD